MLLGGLVGSGVVLFLFWSYQLGPVPVAATLLFLYVPFTSILAALVHRRWPPVREIVSVCLVTAGAVLATDFMGSTGPDSLKGAPQAMLAALTDKEAAASGIGIKLQANAVWGHFWEVTKAELAKQPKVPEHWIHRQTTTGGQRFVSAELQSLERALAGAAQAAQVLEEAVFAELVAAVGTASMALLGVAESLATLDVLAALAEVGAGRGWVAPELSARGPLEIEGGKHPVVSRTRADFMPNDCVLAEGDLWLLTGPNMAGKSTFLRQVALLVVLAQLGSLVPAARMRLGVVDQIFCRLGSADNLAAGQSTFMVEMVETAQILHHATAQSLVILDELGRGTATYDGLAIAWACVEDLVGRVKARTLLATHYHELTALAGSGHGNQHGLVGVSAHQMLVKEWQGAMVFLHQVAPGAAGKSYGVQVAKLAGVPKPVVARAAALLEGFSKASQSRGVVRMDELSLFAAPVGAPVKDAENQAAAEVLAALATTDLDGLSARQALELLHALQSQLKAGSVT
jgi:DNA mismatch repair protein MutS